VTRVMTTVDDDLAVDQQGDSSMTTPPRQPMPFGRETLPPNDKLACGLSRQLTQMFISESKSNIPLGHADTFLMIAANEGRSVAEYAEMAKVSKSVMSRLILDIGDARREHEPGLQWVTARVDPNERRKHEVVLTPKGRILAGRVRELLDLWTSKKRGE
jgi:DNA-binding MarR family transcriptional regulator